MDFTAIKSAIRSTVVLGRPHLAYILYITKRLASTLQHVSTLKICTWENLPLSSIMWYFLYWSIFFCLLY